MDVREEISFSQHEIHETIHCLFLASITRLVSNLALWLVGYVEK